MAIASLICGVMTWILFFIPLLLAIPAVICGHLGHSAVKRGNGAVTGRGIALTGMALGYCTSRTDGTGVLYIRCHRVGG